MQRLWKICRAHLSHAISHLSFTVISLLTSLRPNPQCDLHCTYLCSIFYLCSQRGLSQLSWKCWTYQKYPEHSGVCFPLCLLPNASRWLWFGCWIFHLFSPKETLPQAEMLRFREARRSNTGCAFGFQSDLFWFRYEWRTAHYQSHSCHFTIRWEFGLIVLLQHYGLGGFTTLDPGWLTTADNDSEQVWTEFEIPTQLPTKQLQQQGDVFFLVQVLGAIFFRNLVWFVSPKVQVMAHN